MEVSRSAAQPYSLEDAVLHPSAEKSLRGSFPQKQGQNLPQMPEKDLAEEDVRTSLEQANKLAGIFNRNLKFEYRKEADIYQVSVIDTAKDEVVRKIPPDEMVRFMENIQGLFGAMLDVRA